MRATTMMTATTTTKAMLLTPPPATALFVLSTPVRFIRLRGLAFPTPLLSFPRATTTPTTTTTTTPTKYSCYFSSPLPSRSHQRRRLTAMASAPKSSSSSSSQVAAAPEDAFELIRAHQESAVRLSPVEEIRTFLDNSIRGMLSTFSQDHVGYPSGSMVDFACDHEGSPILAVSSLAVHSKNLLENPKCSLLVAKDPEDRTDTVVTLYGDAVPVSEDNKEAVRAAYLKKHPDAFWVDFGDFRFIHIKPKFVRYVSGVATTLLGSGEFTAEEYKASKVDPISQFAKPIMSHMNRDHAEDTKAIVQYSTSVMVDFAYMLGVDSLGFNVKAGYQGNTLKLRIPFPRRAEDRKDVKTLIVELLQAAKSTSSSSG